MLNKLGFSRKIVEFRKNEGLTQEKLAKKLNVSIQAVSKWERSVCLPDLEVLLQLSKMVNKSINELLEEDNYIEDSIIKDDLIDINNMDKNNLLENKDYKDILIFKSTKRDNEYIKWGQFIHNGKYIEENYKNNLNNAKDNFFIEEINKK